MKTSRTVVGVDTAKRCVPAAPGGYGDRRDRGSELTRAKFLEHFANRTPCVVAMEACGGSQHWARQLLELGHEPWLLPAKAVRPFVFGNKNDARADLGRRRRCPASGRLPSKSEEQQAILALHRMRQQLVKFHTAQINGLRGLLTGVRRGDAAGPGGDAPWHGPTPWRRVSERLPAMVIDTLRDQWAPDRPA